jgi:dolichol-phosphate mannosyltransferase
MTDSVFTRYLRFNFAGVLGVAAQLATLAVLTRVAGLGMLTATACAVEAAILHNFFWHERYTWASRTRTTPQLGLQRFLRFNLSNGAVSIIGNVALMKFLADTAHVPLLLANLVAILACSTFNFFISEYLVFSIEKGGAPPLSAG